MGCIQITEYKEDTNFETDLKRECAKNIISAQAVKIVNKKKPIWKTGLIVDFKRLVFKEKAKYKI